MILRSSALRHGRQALAAAPTRRTFATDHRTPISLPTALADSPPPPPPSNNATNDTSTPSTTDPTAGATTTPAAPVWVPPKANASPLALWNRKRRIVLDHQPAIEFRLKQRLLRTTGRLGSRVRERFQPSSLLRDPPRPADVTLELLLASQCHMGHHASLWNPAMQRFIYGVRAGIHVFSLEEIAAALRRAAKIVEEVAYMGGLILIVGNRKGQMEVVARAAELAGACHLFTKWTPGTITNRDMLLAKEPLKIVDHMDRPVEGFAKHLLERRPVMPELVIVLNPLENYPLLHECAQENIPTIGLVDTNGDPTKVTYTIPGNDDSLRAVSVVAGVLGRAGEAGQKRRKADALRGICTWRNAPEIQRWIEQNLTDNTNLPKLSDEDPKHGIFVQPTPEEWPPAELKEHPGLEPPDAREFEVPPGTYERWLGAHLGRREDDPEVLEFEAYVARMGGGARPLSVRRDVPEEDLGEWWQFFREWKAAAADPSPEDLELDAWLEARNEKVGEDWYKG